MIEDLPPRATPREARGGHLSDGENGADTGEGESDAAKRRQPKKRATNIFKSFSDSYNDLAYLGRVEVENGRVKHFVQARRFWQSESDLARWQQSLKDASRHCRSLDSIGARCNPNWHEERVELLMAHSVLCSAHLGSVQTIWIVNYEAWELSVRPRSPSMVGALMDIVVNVLEMDRNGNMRRQAQKPEVRSPSSSSWLPSPKGTRERFKDQTDAAIMRMVNDAIHNAIDLQIERARQTLGLCCDALEEQVGRARALHGALRALLPGELPPPSRQLVTAVQEGFAGIRGRHGAIGPAAAVRRPARCARAPELAAGTACLGFAGCCFLGLHTGCLAVAAGAVAGVAQLGKEVAARAAPWLNAMNRRAWEDCVARPKFTSPAVPAWSSFAERPEAPPRSAAESASPASGTPCGFEVCVESKAATEISGELLSYIVDQYYADHWLQKPLKVLQPPLKWWASRLLAPNGGTAPLAVAIQVPEQIVPDLPWDLWLPDFPLLLTLDVDLWSRGPYLRGARLAIADAVVDRLVEAVRVQVQMWDFRDADPRFRDFCEPLQVSFGIDLQWPSPEQLNVEVSNFATTLHLPA